MTDRGRAKSDAAHSLVPHAQPVAAPKIFSVAISAYLAT